MGCEEIINLIWEENALDAKKALEVSLYERAAYALRDIAPDSSRRSFRDQNACPDHVILGEAEKSPEQKAFQALFDKILKKHGVDSPNELEDSKKDDFFNEVEREWKKDPANTPEKNESDNEHDDPRYVTTPRRMPKRRPNPLFGQPGGADTPFKIPMGIPYLPRPEVGEPGGPAGPPQPKPYARPTRPLAPDVDRPDSRNRNARRMPRRMPSMQDIMKMMAQYNEQYQNLDKESISEAVPITDIPIGKPMKPWPAWMIPLLPFLVPFLDDPKPGQPGGLPLYDELPPENVPTEYGPGRYPPSFPIGTTPSGPNKPLA